MLRVVPELRGLEDDGFPVEAALSRLPKTWEPDCEPLAREPVHTKPLLELPASFLGFLEFQVPS